MDMTYRSKCIFILGSMFVLSFAVSGQAQSLPEGQGKAEFQRICGNCHSVEYRYLTADDAGAMDRRRQ